MVKNEIEISMVEVADVHVISHLSNMIYSEQLLWAGNLKKKHVYMNCYYMYYFSFYLVGHSARKRRRGSENIDIEERLESLITRVGEKVHTYYIIYICISLHLIKSFYNCRLTSIKHYILFIK